MLDELPALHRLSRHLADDVQEADDLLQESLLRALRAAGRFVLGPMGIRPWLFKILYNTHRNLRRDRPVERLFEDFENDTKHAAPAEPSAASLATLDWEQVDEELYAAVQSLSEDYRVIFLLFAVEQLKYREIGEVLGVPLGTVMSRLARARQQLIERLPNVRRSRVVRAPASPRRAPLGASDE